MSNSPEDHIRSKPFPKKYKRTFWGMRFTSSGYSTERPGPSHGTHGAPRVSRAPLKAKQRDEAGRASLLPTLCESQGTAHILCLGATGVPHGWSRLPKYSTHLPKLRLRKDAGGIRNPGWPVRGFLPLPSTGMPLPGCRPALSIKPNMCRGSFSDFTVIFIAPSGPQSISAPAISSAERNAPDTERPA